MDQITIGDRIRELRRAKNLTQDDLAVLINSNRVQINQWETGARELSATRVVEFAAALDTSCEYLLRGVHTEQAESYNQTGLDMHALNALSDLMKLTEHKKEQYLYLLNSILGSDCFWHTIMPHLLAALTIQENAVLGGAFAGLKDFHPESMADKIKDSINTVTFSNMSGYTDHIVINKEAAIAFQLQEAMDIFKLLLKAILEKHALQKDNPLAPFTRPYRTSSNPDEELSIVQFLEYAKAMGITLEK